MTMSEFLNHVKMRDRSKFHGFSLANFPSKELGESLTDQVDFLVHNLPDSSKKVGILMKMQVASESAGALTIEEKNEVGKHIHHLLTSWIPIVNAERGHSIISMPEPLPRKKLVWHGKPSEFGHIFFELHSKGWIGLPNGGEIVYSEFARICLELFDFEPKTTEGNLAKELNPNVGKNTLADDSKKRFKIAFESEMNPKRPREKK